MTSSTSTSSFRLGIAGMALVVAGIVVSGCGVNPQPTGYGDQYEENFMLGCTGIDPDTGEVPNGGEVLAPEDDCVCIYDNLEEKVPFDEAKEFEEQQAEAESGQDIEIPDNIAAIIDDCTGSSGDS